MNYYVDVIKKYAVFEGRAGRKEYWMFALFNLIIAYALYFLDIIIFGPKGIHAFYYVYCLATFIPTIAVMTRRLHDTNHSAWWYFINFIPVVGVIWFLVFLARDSDAVDNKYGSIPPKTLFKTLQRIGVSISIIAVIILACNVGYFNYKYPTYQLFFSNQLSKPYSKMSLTDCSRIQNIDNRTTCIILAISAIENPDAKTCDTFNNGSQCTDSSLDFKSVNTTCYQMCLNRIYAKKASAMKDSSFCGQMTAGSAKDGCYGNVAKENSDYLLCSNIEKNTSRNLCYNDIAQATKNPFICAKLFDPLDDTNEVLCYSGIAEKTNDYSVCSQIGESERDKYGLPIRNSCLDSFLTATRASMVRNGTDNPKLPSELLKKVCPLYIPPNNGWDCSSH